MKLVVSIDDTDMPGGPGSGQLAERLTREIESRGLGFCDGICRHQLFVHEDVPYTSHNSSMSFLVETESNGLDQVIVLGQKFLSQESAQGSDPGFCVVAQDERLTKGPLIEFGKQAKKEIMDKKSAYGLAAELGIHLSEHGGTGDGVIGALAGAGLRLYGSDGRMRGWYKDCFQGEEMTVADLLCRTGAESAVDECWCDVESHALVQIGDKRVKSVMYMGRKVIPLVKVAGGGVQALWATLTKEEVKRF